MNEALIAQLARLDELKLVFSEAGRAAPGYRKVKNLGIKNIALIAQLVELLPLKETVVGSNPSERTRLKIVHPNYF